MGSGSKRPPPFFNLQLWLGQIRVPLAFTATLGKSPRISARQLVHPVLITLLFMGLAAATTGLLTYYTFQLPPSDYHPLPPHEERLFQSILATHQASYFSGFLGGLTLCLHTAYRRHRRAKVLTSA